MDKFRHPSTLENLAASLSSAGRTYEIFNLILRVLDEHEKVLYACREDLKLVRGTSAAADRTASECLRKFQELKLEVTKLASR